MQGHPVTFKRVIGEADVPAISQNGKQDDGRVLGERVSLFAGAIMRP